MKLGEKTDDARDTFDELKTDWNGPDHQLRLTRATQTLRVSQSKRTVPWICIASLIFILVYFNDPALKNILIWAGLTTLAMVSRFYVARYISSRIDSSEIEMLNKFEVCLFSTSMFNGLVIGSGVWWVGLFANGSQNVVYAATLTSAVYAFGSMINASVQYRSFAPTVVVNVGQSVIYFSGFVDGWGSEPALSSSLLIILFAQLGLGRVNANQFEESIKIRAENVRLVKKLSSEKLLVEDALLLARLANESKSNFLAAASHDLRQPLHALSLYLGSLSMQVKDERGQQLLGRIANTTDVLREQFNSLLDLARFDAKGVRVELSTFRMDELLVRLAAEFESNAIEKNLSIQVDSVPCAVTSDPLLLERMIRNLVENAIRYTKEGGVCISTEPSAEKIKVTVMDTGRGISVEDQARVFEDFVQLHKRERNRSSGVGLGLAIVRRISTTLDLGIRVESNTEGGGTSFFFEVPIAFLHQAKVPDTHSEIPIDFGKDVLVWAIDDDEDVNEALKLQFESWGCVIHLAGSWSGIKRLRVEDGRWPDLVLLDDMLRELDTGLDIARRLAEEMPRHQIKLVTGNTKAERLKEIRESGFEVLLKPTQIQKLKELVVRAKEMQR
ncbi:MAG: signal transduction histidine kinase/CheY-like chemotaxis protein [Flavobacterium sp.]|jgi:signal transduction histidine kinase/CheY-like chemotaxis protein